MSGGVQKRSDALARMKHAGLHGVRGHSDNPGNFRDRLLMVVNKIDDFPLNG